MATESPLNPLHAQAEAAFLWHGLDSATTDPSARTGAAVVETFGEVEGEYAAIRKGCVVIDVPQRGAIRVTGADRVEFLNRMLTNDLKALNPFQTREAFLISRKGRIEADLKIVELADEMHIEADALVAGKTIELLNALLFSEDVQLHDATQTMHRLTLHGPTAAALLMAISEPVDGPTISDLAASSAHGATIIHIAGQKVIVDRRDDTGEVGFGLLMERGAVERVYEQILERGLDAEGASRAFRLRPAGWAAFNIARIEAGAPIFNLDFGPNSLPAESGVLERRVSFTKGCYPGQEVVARMKSLGHPKQRLVGLKLTEPPRVSGESQAAEAQPVTGALLTTADDPKGKAVGAVTSSTRSPMLGDAGICFAQVKWDHSAAGTQLVVETDAGPMPAVVQESLVFWKAATSA